MKSILLVALGGALGSITRYKLSGWVLHHAVHWRFPISTFMVNIIGCFIIGLLAGFAIKNNLITDHARIFLFTGVLGGFTTFSAFGLETFYLLKRGEIWIAASYVLLSVLAGLLVLWLGFSLIPHKN